MDNLIKSRPLLSPVKKFCHLAYSLPRGLKSPSTSRFKVVAKYVLAYLTFSVPHLKYMCSIISTSYMQPIIYAVQIRNQTAYIICKYTCMLDGPWKIVFRDYDVQFTCCVYASYALHRILYPSLVRLQRITLYVCNDWSSCNIYHPIIIVVVITLLGVSSSWSY